MNKHWWDDFFQTKENARDGACFSEVCFVRTNIIVIEKNPESHLLGGVKQ